MNMKIATTRVADPGDNWHGPIVELTTDNHMTLTVNLPLSAAEEGSDPIERALGALSSLASAAEDERTHRCRDGKSSARSAQDRGELEDQLNKGLEDSFPASDPVATVVTSTLPKRAKADG